MPKKKNLENFRTIYIIKNNSNVIFSAFTSEEEAKKEIDFRYLTIQEKFNIEPCALKLDSNFIENIKKAL